MTYNSLPGFDAWLTTQPTEEEIPEPSEYHFTKARATLARYPWPVTDGEVNELAYIFAAEDYRAHKDDFEEHSAESSREDSEDRYGDGPL